MSGQGVNRAPTQSLFPEFMDPTFLVDEVNLNRNFIRKAVSKAVRVSLDLSGSQMLLDLDEALLDLPLGSTEDHELSAPVNDSDLDHEDLDQETSFDESVQVWSQEAVVQLHESLVMYSLRLLNARGNGKEKKAILSWIFCPEDMVFNTTSGEPGWKFIKSSDVPFSFDLCCRICGYDAERLREGLVPVLKKLGLENLFKEINREQHNAADRAHGLPHSLHIQHSRGAGKSANHGTQAGTARSSGPRPLLPV